MPRTTKCYLDPQPLFDALTKDNDVQLAKRLGVSRETIGRWRNGKALVKLQTADQIAIRLRLHPANIWGDEYFALILQRET